MSDELKIMILFILLCFFEASAKDTIYSLNKYQKESLDNIIRGYTENNKKDGFITSGSIENKEKKNQPIIIKYKATGEICWIYTHPTTEDEELLDITYTYQNNQVDGYLILIAKESKSILIKVDLSGILCWQKEFDESYEKIVALMNDNNQIEKIVILSCNFQINLINEIIYYL